MQFPAGVEFEYSREKRRRSLEEVLAACLKPAKFLSQNLQESIASTQALLMGENIELCEESNSFTTRKERLSSDTKGLSADVEFQYSF